MTLTIILRSLEVPVHDTPSRSFRIIVVSGCIVIVVGAAVLLGTVECVLVYRACHREYDLRDRVETIDGERSP